MGGFLVHFYSFFDLVLYRGFLFVSLFILFLFYKMMNEMCV